MPQISRGPLPGLIALVTLVFLSLANVAVAEPAESEFDPDEIMAFQGGVTLSQNEIDAAFSKIPQSDRMGFIRDGGKVDQLIRLLLQRKAIAADARKAGYDADPVMAARLGLEAEKELAEAWLQDIVAKAPEPDLEALAREDYLTNPDAYRSPETLDVSHILISVEECSQEEARVLTASLERQLNEDPSRFDALVAEYSDDPMKAENGGRYAEMRRGMMTAPFEKAAFALENPGDISGPVKTEYGWHIIRLNKRSGNELQEFAAVKDQALARARKDFLETYRDNYLRKVLSEPVVIPDKSVEIMAKRHFGENLEKAPGTRN